MRRVNKNLCPATISALLMAVNMWKNSLKNVESDNNKILYETLLDFCLKGNGTYFMNKPRLCVCVCVCIYIYIYIFVCVCVCVYLVGIIEL